MNNENEFYEPEIIGVTSEDGEEILFELLDRYEENDDTYIAVTPYYDNSEDIVESDCELIILKVYDEDGEELLGMIEDEDELDRIFRIFEEKLSDLYEIEPMDE